MSENQGKVGCFDCERPYGNEHGFPDLVIQNDIWARISPTGDEGGLLCPSCICKRLYDAGIKEVEAAFMSGPVRSVDRAVMSAICGIDNVTKLLTEILEEGKRE
jgi:hypothetical protein